MKALVGATCIAVIAFVGYFFWGEYAKETAREKAAVARSVTAFSDNCFRLVESSPKYDKKFAMSLSPTDRKALLQECVDAFQKNKLPD